jgi:putative pyruvate formate lyase activating enzyme
VKSPGYSKEDQALLSNCTLCPRNCGVNRFRGTDGYCGTGAGMNVAAVCIHRGEEPPISGAKGICNIFFSGCNLRCIFCQNHDISRPGTHRAGRYDDPDQLLEAVAEILSQGINAVGFVSPSHSVPQMKLIISSLHAKGLRPVTVYNTNSYDRVETLREISDLVDVYLPDFKYATADLARQFSDAPDYPETALKALKEMYYQKGSKLITGEDGTAESGILLRHLVLPGHAEDSKNVLRLIASEISSGISISLMSQYHPVSAVSSHAQLGRLLYADEYRSVAEEMEKLGFRNGWLQSPESSENYLPDFSREHPFE